MRAGREDKRMNTMANVLNNSCLLIDTDKLRENTRTILRTLPAGTKLIPVVKDDAYGMGMVGIVRTLCAFPEIDCFAVANVSEGLLLRREGVRQEILVMSGALPFQYAAAVEGELTLTIGRAGMASELTAVCAAQRKSAKVQIKIETGLHRIGVEPGAELAGVAEELKAAEGVLQVTGAFSHFACPSDAAACQKQYEFFLQGVEQLEAAGITVPLRHINGSEGTELFPQYSLDAVRVGRRLYMDNPTKPLGGIHEVASWRSYVTNVRVLHAGDTLGYDGAFRLKHDALVATVAVGYGDGLHEGLVACHAPVLVGGKRCPLLACCIDQCFLDVTQVGAKAGDEVTFFGCDAYGNFLSSQETANRVGRNEGCGLTAALAQRVARLYV